jgi:5-methylcytosine-specific restriction endonuclease McrA
MIEGKKKCGRCGEIKPLDKFYRDKSRKDGLTPQCKACRMAYSSSAKSKEVQRRYRQTEKYKQSEARKVSQEKYKNSEKGIATRKRYNKAYSKTQKKKEAARRYYMSRKGKEKRRKYVESKKDELREYYLQYSRTEKRKRAISQYGKSPKGRQVAKKSKSIRRSNETSAGGSYTHDQWYELCKFYKFHCLKCNEQFAFEKLTFDHVKPVSKGGTSFIWNAQPLCRECNQQKHNKEIDYRKTLPDWIKRDGPMWIQSRLF